MRLKDAKIGFLGSCFRVFQTLFFVDVGVPGVALTLNPRLKALGLSPSAFNLSGWIPSAPYNSSKYPHHRQVMPITAAMPPFNRNEVAK